MPGINASICQNPNIKACLIVQSDVLTLTCSFLSENQSKIPNPTIAMPIISVLSLIYWYKPVYFNVAPKTTAGIVATTKQTTKLLSRPFKFPEKNLEALAIMAFTSVQKNVVTAIRLPR